MPERSDTPTKCLFVAPRKIGARNWEIHGEIPRRPGTLAQVARSLAIQSATRGMAKTGDPCARCFGASGEWPRFGRPRTSRRIVRGARSSGGEQPWLVGFTGIATADTH
jgi:hypothetical protein